LWGTDAARAAFAQFGLGAPGSTVALEDATLHPFAVAAPSANLELYADVGPSWAVLARSASSTTGVDESPAFAGYDVETTRRLESPLCENPPGLPSVNRL